MKRPNVPKPKHALTMRRWFAWSLKRSKHKNSRTIPKHSNRPRPRKLSPKPRHNRKDETWKRDSNHKQESAEDEPPPRKRRLKLMLSKHNVRSWSKSSETSRRRKTRSLRRMCARQNSRSNEGLNTWRSTAKLNVSMYLFIHVSMYLCIYMCMYLCVYVSMYLCIYVS